MEAIMEGTSSLVVLSTVVLCGGIISFLFWFINKTGADKQDQDESNNTRKHSEDASTSNGVPSGAGGKGSKKVKPAASKAKDLSATFGHKWLQNSFKGHTGQVLDIDFSSNGKYLVSCDVNRALMVWHVKDVGEKEIRSVRGNVELDHASRVKFSPDSKALIVCKATANRLAVYKMVKKEGGAVSFKIQEAGGVTYPELHKRDIINIGISCSGKFLMSASGDTMLIVWDLHGTALKVLDTKQSNINYACVSPCGRFVASSGFTPDVKVWEVGFSRTGEFQDVTRAFDLKGHDSGVHSFAFNADSTKMVTASKDGTWRVWDTDIRYQHGQDPYLVQTGSLPLLRDTPALVAIAPSGTSFAIATKRDIRVFRTFDGVLDEDATLANCHSDFITALTYSADSAFLASAGDKHVRLFHNVAGYRAQIAQLIEQLRTATVQGTKERLNGLLEKSRAELDAILA